jgi:hypothetical protein
VSVNDRIERDVERDVEQEFLSVVTTKLELRKKGGVPPKDDLVRLAGELGVSAKLIADVVKQCDELEDQLNRQHLAMLTEARARAPSPSRLWRRGEVANLVVVKPEPKPEPKPKPKADDWATLAIPANATELERLTYVPGLVGELQSWIVRTSIRPNRMMALGTGLCVVGTLIGRHVAGPTDSATHLYIVHLAPSGWGKDDPLLRGDSVMAAVAPHLIGPSEFASSPGFVKKLAQNALFVCFVDEFGDELDKVKSQGNNAFVRNIVGTLKKCWNAFHSFNSADKAGELGQRIEWPAPSIIAAATPERFFGSLTNADFESGFINRFLILPFEGHKRPPEQIRIIEPPPEGLIEALKALPSSQSTILQRPVQGGNGKPVKQLVGWGDDEAPKLYLAFSRKMDFNEHGDRRRFELGMRATEYAVRLATIVAVGRGVGAVYRDDIAWGIALAEQSFEAANGGAERYMHEYFEFPKQCERCAEAFRKAEFISESKFYREFGRNQRWGNELDRVITQLKREGRIREARLTPPNGGPRMKGWEWIGGEGEEQI